MAGSASLPDESERELSRPATASAAGSISVLIQRLREQADQDAAHDLYKKYFDQLVSKLRSRINRRVQAVTDSEDVAQFALAEVLGKIVDGWYPDLGDRNSLWALMVHIGDARTKQVWRDATAGKRDVRREYDPLALPQSDAMRPDAFDPESDSISPEMLVEIQDILAYLSDRLSKKEYRDMLTLELQGHSPADIKRLLEDKLKRSVTESSLRRWRRLMREELRAHYPDDFPVG